MRCLVIATSLLAACQLPGDVSLSTSTTQGDDGATTQVASSSDAATTSAATFDSADASADGLTAAEATTGTTADDTSTSGTTGSDTSTAGTTGQAITTCKKVDLLFFIADGVELWDTEGALEDMVPHVAERLETDFADWDYHLMVIKGDNTWGDAGCNEVCAEGEGHLCKTATPYPCDYEPTACDLTLGAGLTFPAGGGTKNVACSIDGDQRYIARGQHDLASTFDCTRRVGTGDTKHRVVEATLGALSDPLNAPGACNEGFLREDAYLILFVLSPFPDFYAEGTPADWTKELKSHKGGKFDKIYFIGLFQGCMSPFGWKEYEPLNEWVSSLYYHALDDACTGDVLPYIDPALDYVLGDCQE